MSSERTSEILERGFLGMTHNPFITPGNTFFPAGDRQTHLEQLRHLSQWSRRILVVTGPQGVGKSVLYRQLSATLEPRVKAARIDGAFSANSQAAMSAMLQGFGVAAPAGCSQQVKAQLISGHVQAQQADARQCVVLVDNADLLDHGAVDALLSLVVSSPIRLVLFGKPTLVSVLTKAARPLGLEWHEIRLTGYSRETTREYLEWRFSQAKYRGRSPFTDVQVDDIATRSGGLPGRIDELANEQLLKIQVGDIDRKKGFPMMHAALAGLIAVSVALAYVLLQEESVDTEQQAMSRIELPNVPVEPDYDLPDPLDSADDEVGAEPVLESPEVDQATAEADAEPTSETMSAAQDVEVVVQSEQNTTSEQKSEPAPVPAPVPAPAKEVVVAPVKVTPVEAKHTAPAEQSSSAALGGAQDANWLLAQNATHYTLQLVSVSSMERAAAFVQKQPEPGQFGIYALARDGRRLFVVTYGSFQTREQAEEASRTLPATVGPVKPWLRTFAQIHEAIRTVR